MKNKLNLNQLSMSWGEKQSPQRFGRYAVMLIMLLTLGVGQMWASNTYTVYCVPEWMWGDNWSDSGTDWVRVNYQNETNNDNSWAQASMSKTELRYSGYDIYKATFVVWYDGVATLQFQRMTGGTNTVEATYGAISPWWDGSNWTGKLFTTSWGALTYDTYDVTATADVYFDNTETNWSNVSIHFVQSGGTYDYAFTQISGTPYWKYSFTTNWNDYGTAIFFQSDWGHQSGRLYANIGSGTTLFTPNSGSDYAGFSTTAPVGPKNISISNTASTIRGGGTSSNPYVVAPGTSITQSVSAEEIDASTTLYYKFSAGSATSYSSSTRTNTRIASAVAGTSYTVYATVKTQKNSVDSRAFNTNTLYYTTAYTITLNDNTGSGGDGASYAVNGKAAINPTSIPTKSGKGFDGYWTGSGGTGTQVINEKGQWISGVAGYTDNSGNWICTSNSTLYARWLDPGYYMVGGFNGWKATTKMSGSGPYTWDTESLEPSDYTSNKTEFKIRKVVAGSGTNDVWYGGSSSGIELGKSTPSSTSIASPGNNFVLQVYYDGVYTFTWTANSKIQVAVPVVDQLRIYYDNGASVSIYTDWVDPSAATVTATVALERGHEYQFKPVLESVYYGKGSGNSFTTLTRDSRTVTVGTGNDNANNVKLSADLKGNYQFSFNTSTKLVTVTYPTRRQIQYSVITVGSGSGNNGNLSAENDSDGDCAVANNGYVVDGNSVTFKAVSAKDGYTFRGWYSTNSPSAANWNTGRLTTEANYTVTVSGGTKTVYAVYSENKSAITIAAGSNGTISTPNPNNSPYSLGVATKQAITASPNSGYRFVNWTCTGVAAVDDATSKSTNAKSDGTDNSSGTVTANFAGRYALEGSKKSSDSDLGGMPGWTINTCNMDTKAATSIKAVTLDPNTEFKYKIHDLSQNPGMHGQTGTDFQPLGTPWTLNNSNDTYFKTKGYGSYTFSIVEGDNPSVTITGPTSYQITSGQQTKTDGVGVVGTGGKVGAVDGDDFTMFSNLTNSETKWVKTGGSVTFTATPNSGYQFMGWYSSATTNDGGAEAISTENPYTVSNITTDKTVYALFKEVLYDVVVKVDGVTPETMQVGVVSHPSLVADVPSDKVFDRWITTGSAVVGSNYSSSTTLNSASDYQSTVTATFKDLPKIYIDLEAATDWRPQNMYVYFYSGEYWSSDNGTGANSGGVLIQGSCLMTNIAGTNIWYYEYNPNVSPFSGRTITHVTFADQSRSSGYFNSCTAVYRTDFQSCMNMFIMTDNTGVKYNSQNCFYRNTNKISGHDSKGYWANYGELNSGYYLNNLAGGSYEFTDPDGDGTYTTTLSLEGNKDDYYFYVGGCNGWNWSSEHVYTTANPSGTLNPYASVTGNDNMVKLCTTAGGYYTFSLTPTNSGRNITVAITYPISSGDYRVTYTHDGKAFPSNIIKTGQSSGTVSLWLNTGSNTVKIEKCTGTNPVTWTQQGQDKSVSTSKKGVYTMTLTCNGASSTLSTPELYTGKFFIRTDCAPGGWQKYEENVLTQNSLTFSEADASTFDYYFCKWVSSSGTNVRCVIANEYNMAISDTLKGDDILGGVGVESLPAAANIRFSYNSYTNALKRAYISGSTDPKDRFLIMHGNVDGSGDPLIFDSNGDPLDYSSTYSTLHENEAYFYDRNNWVYYVELKAKNGAKTYLTANFNNADRNLYGSSSDLKPVLTSSSDDQYGLLVTYDFKTNNLMTAWHPGSVTVKDTMNVPSVMIIRKHQGTADQVRIGAKGDVNETTVYGVMKFNKYLLNNQNETDHSYDPTPATQRALYWISFPFDVVLNEVFGFGEYGKHWIIEYYDGAERAQKGFWADSDPFWKFVTPAMRSGGYELKKGMGYVLALDLDELGTGSSIWNNNVKDIYLYFPSKNLVEITNDKPTSVEVPAHQCTINRQQEGDPYNINKNRTIADSHWNIIGVPLYADDTNQFVFEGTDYYYAWDYATDTYSAQNHETGNLKSMYAYMVQFEGYLNWSTHATTHHSVVGRTRAAEDIHFAEFKLDLLREEENMDHTFVRLSDAEEVTTSFEFGKDLSKEFNSGKANIYTIINNYLPAAANSLPIGDETTIVPVGVKIVADGEYTFAMPDGTSGIGVTLIDNETGERTNLGLMDYTTALEAGTHDGRFVLEISPIKDTPTIVEEVTGDGLQVTGARKVMIDGTMYIVRDGKVFDARGGRVQ